MNDTEYVRILDSGIVEHVKEVVYKKTSLDVFYPEMKKHSPSGIMSPMLPYGTVAYNTQMNEETSDRYEKVLIFVPHSVRSIFFHRHRSSPNDPAEHYKVSFPHCVFKFTFRNGRMESMHAGVVKDRPARMQDEVFLLKMPNVNETGSVCIQLLREPGDMAESCYKTLDSFFAGQPFSQDWVSWPQGIRSFQQWQDATESHGPRFILEKEWPRISTIEEYMKG